MFEYEPLLNDGLLECVLIRNPTSPADVQSILSAIVTQDLECPNIVKFTTRSVTFTSTEAIKWTTDGEDGWAEISHDSSPQIFGCRFSRK